MKNKVLKNILIISIIVVAVVFTYILKKVSEIQNDNKVMIDAESNDYTGKKVVKLINFSSKTCEPCKRLEPLILELIKEYEGKVEIIEADVDEYSDLCMKYRILYTPTQIYLDEDGNEIYRNSSFVPKSEIRYRLKLYGVE